MPAAALRRAGHPPGRWLYVDDGSRRMEFSPHDDTAVLRWMMRCCGVVLAGPEPASLIDPVDPDDIRREAAGSLRHWAVRLVDEGAGLESAWAWSPLVERAIADRPDPWVRVHRPADPALVGSTRAVVDHGRRVARDAGRG